MSIASKWWYWSSSVKPLSLSCFCFSYSIFGSIVGIFLRYYAKSDGCETETGGGFSDGLIRGRETEPDDYCSPFSYTLNGDNSIYNNLSKWLIK